MKKQRVKKPIYKKWWFWTIIVLLVISAFGGGGDNEDEATNDIETEAVAEVEESPVEVTPSEDEAESETEDDAAEDAAEAVASEAEEEAEVEAEDDDEGTLSFELVAGEEGEYGELFTMNKGTEFEETYYIYHVPSGTYTVTNTGEYMNQFNVYSDEITVNDAGWEEVAEVFYAEVLDVGASDAVTIEDGQFIEIHEPGKFLLELQSEAEDVQTVAEDAPRTDFAVAAAVQQEDVQEPVAEETVVEDAAVEAPEPVGTDYVGNKNSKKFHYSYCGSVDQMNESNKYYFTGTRDDMMAKGYTPCAKCNP